MIRRAVFSAALACLIATSAAASSENASLRERLTAAWPGEDAIERIQGEELRLGSQSPFALTDIVTSFKDAKTEAQATFFLPPQASARKKVPAVVLLHGASGVQWARELTYARQFAAMGVAAIVIDVFAARRDRGQSFIERILNITETMMLADAYAALRYLNARPEIDGSRVALMGFSYGGMSSIFASYRLVADRFLPRTGLRFAAHVAFYGPCIARFEDRRTTGAPVLMLWGTEDGIIDAARCKEIADDLTDGGSNVKLVAYSGAYHQWDGSWTGPFRLGRTLVDCELEVGTDAVIRDQNTPLSMSGPFTRKLILGLCSDDSGYLIGKDDAVRVKSNLEVGRFLAAIFDPGPAQSTGDD